MNLEQIIGKLKALGNSDDVAGMARFGIVSKKILGVRVPDMRRLAGEIGTDHELALQLWEAGYRETRILASMVADPLQVTEKLMDGWAGEFDNWEVCDQCCMNLFDKTPFAVRKCFEWSGHKELFIKRAGFALMARLAWKAKDLTNNQFELFFLPIRQQATDGRNEVKKAISWALRQIGKRNEHLNSKAIDLAEEISKEELKAAKWIANDILKELRSDAVRKRLGIS